MKAQRTMEQKMNLISLKERKRNEWIRNIANVKLYRGKVAELKW